jgi:hypothetical protein
MLSGSSAVLAKSVAQCVCVCCQPGTERTPWHDIIDAGWQMLCVQLGSARATSGVTQIICVRRLAVSVCSVIADGFRPALSQNVEYKVPALQACKQAEEQSHPTSRMQGVCQRLHSMFWRHAESTRFLLCQQESQSTCGLLHDLQK